MSKNRTEFCVVVQVTEVVWVLHKHSTVFASLAPVEGRDVSNNKFNIEGMALGLDDINVLRESAFTEEILFSLSVVDVVRHLNSFCGRCSFVEQRCVGDRHIC